MKDKYIVALDQGTTSSRCIIFDRYCNIISKSQKEFKQIYPKPGWVEHNQQDILNTQIEVYKDALKTAGISPKDIAALGIANQRETVIVWDKISGRPVYNAIVWQCRRTADYMQKLKSQGFSDMIFSKTGLVMDAYFSASKIKWILDNVSGARAAANRGELLAGTVDTYLMWCLSGNQIFATDYTNASRTMLFNIHTLEWDKELCKLFDIPQNMLPQVFPSGHIMGCADKSVLGESIPIACAVGDQQGSLFGHLCINEGDIKNTYGTGCFLLLNTGKHAVKSNQRLITTLCAGLSQEPSYALEGSVFVGGAVIQWLRDGLKLLRTSCESEKYARKVNDTEGVFLVPAFTGLGAPYWDGQARGIITGLTRGTKKEHIIRAALESIAYQSLDVLNALEKDLGSKINRLNVDGGACVNDFLMQFQADIADLEVVRPNVLETTALGAAYLAGLAIGYWDSIDELKRNNEEKIFYSEMDVKRRKTLIDNWHKAIQRARG